MFSHSTTSFHDMWGGRFLCLGFVGGKPKGCGLALGARRNRSLNEYFCLLCFSLWVGVREKLGRSLADLAPI